MQIRATTVTPGEVRRHHTDPADHRNEDVSPFVANKAHLAQTPETTITGETMLIRSEIGFVAPEDEKKQIKREIRC